MLNCIGKMAKFVLVAFILINQQYDGDRFKKNVFG